MHISNSTHTHTTQHNNSSSITVTSTIIIMSKPTVMKVYSKNSHFTKLQLRRLPYSQTCWALLYTEGSEGQTSPLYAVFGCRRSLQ